MKENQLTELQRAELHECFQLGERLEVKTAPSLCVLELLEPGCCADFLHRLCRATGSPTIAIAASQFAKRYAALFVVPALFAMTAYDKALNSSLSNIWLETAEWKPRVMLQSCDTTDAIGKLELERKDWYASEVNKLFTYHLAPLWQSFASVSSISPLILWENTAVRIYSLFEKKIEKLVPDHKKKQAQHDFSTLLSLEGGKFFGESYNPLARFYTAQKFQESTTSGIRMRRTCCFYYKTVQPAKYCESCPCRQT